MEAAGPKKSDAARTIRFGPFQLDVRAGELRKGVARIRLSDQPLQVLLMLLERPGGLVLREEIRNRLWPGSTVVEFDHSINAAVRRLRDALRESADSPRYVETIPRRGYRFIGEVESPGEVRNIREDPVTPIPTPPHAEASQSPEASAAVPSVQPRSRRPWRAVAVISAALALLAAIGAAWYSRHQAPVRWAREVALPQAARLAAAGDNAAAFPWIFRALQILPEDPALNRVRRETSASIAIRTSPPGASLSLKPYTDPDSPWLFIGESPLENFLLPFGYYRWRITKPGFETLDTAAGIQEAAALTFVLDPKDSIPADMVHVPAGDCRVFGLRPVHLEDYWIDKFEVTNRRFKEFVDKGGYRNPAYWRNQFVKGGRVLSWKHAMDEFRDTTGQPGPSTWEVGGYPAGHDDFPVNGLSWYEAAAYAEFAKKQLPTVYHWYRAAAQGIYSEILLFSNFDGTGPLPVGSKQGVGRFGAYDMAGNVKEWCLNATGARRYILGGSWNEGRSYYVAPDALSPFDRSSTNGFRCARYAGAVSDALTATVERPSDRRLGKPASGSLFGILLNFYAYDRGELRPVTESSDESAEGWRTERISFNAAYERERVIAWLYLPKNAKPPYQTIIYAPAGASRILPKIDQAEIRRFDFLMRSGRAVLLPVYWGTYERRQSPQPGGGGDREVIKQVQDLRRSIDYLETRTDIARDRIGFFGISGGSEMGVIALAQEARIRAATLAESGIPAASRPPELDPVNFASRVRIPVLMLNGRDDFMRPLETAQIPLFRLLGSPPNEKRHELFDTGHMGQAQQYIKKTLDWFDRYLGPVIR